MTALRARLAWSAAALTLVACAPPHGGVAQTSPPAASPTAALREPLIAVLDRPFGAAPNTLRLLRLDGAEVAAVALDPDAEAITAAGSRLLIAGSGRLSAVERDGTTAALPTLPADADTALVRGLVASPDGSRWMWSSVVQSAAGVESRVYLAGSGSTGTLLLDRHESGAALQPVAWTAEGPVLADEPLGIGGYVLFRRTFGTAALLDLGRRALRPLVPDDCAFSDMAADGTVACVRNGREGPHGDGAVSLQLIHVGRPDVVVTLPASMQQAGAAFFRPDGAALSLAMSPALGEGSEQIETDLVDVASGARHTFGPSGVMPAAWLPDGRMVAVRLPGVVGGAAGTYVVSADGSNAVLVSPASTVVGVLR